MRISFLISLRQLRQQRLLSFFLLFLAGVFGIIAISMSAAIANPANSPVPQPVPTITEDVGGAQVMLPDWDNISFSTLPPVLTGGQIGSQWNDMIGYDLSRVWSEGDAVGDVIKLGDISEGFSAEQFSLNGIGSVTGLGIDAIESMPLESFDLVGDQTLVELVTAMPDLATLKIEDIAPINDLVTLIGQDAWEQETLGAFVNGNAIAEELKLGGMDDLTANLSPELAQVYDIDLANLDMGQYSIADIPGLSDVPFEEFARWENQFPSDIPGLIDVAFSQMPNGVGNAGVIARVDTVMGTAEAQFNRTVSGSTEIGFSHPCNRNQPDTKNCAHIELDDIENAGDALQLPFEGRAWVSGSGQKVPGGYGALKAMFGGKEPTGRHPFSDSFKVVIETDETTDTFQTLLYFRVCKTFLGCSPYGIGPVPFLTFRLNDYIVIGPPDFGGGASIPSGSSSAGNLPSSASGASGTGSPGSGIGSAIGNGSSGSSSNGSGSSSSVGSSGNGSGSSSGGGSDEFRVAGGVTPEESAQQSGIAPLACTGEEEYGINLDVLGDAIAQVLEPADGYFTVGVSTGTSFKLGRYAYESDDPLVRDWVSRVAGGPDWLAQLDQGQAPSRFGLETYFPSMLQNQIFKAEMRQYLAIAREEIDPRTNAVFTGSRLIERVAQLAFGGVGSPIDSKAKGRQGPTLYRYGVKARTFYYGQGGQTQCPD